jgi:hypothetical protein
MLPEPVGWPILPGQGLIRKTCSFALTGEAHDIYRDALDAVATSLAGFYGVSITASSGAHGLGYNECETHPYLSHRCESHQCPHIAQYACSRLRENRYPSVSGGDAIRARRSCRNWTSRSRSLPFGDGPRRERYPATVPRRG